MEDKGADPSSVLEASLKGVRDSDIYVGIFGRDFSSVTIQEYEEAVNYKKPCLVYVKRCANRDVRLEKFKGDVLKRDFKYFEFGRNASELINQVEIDLENFIVDTLRMGIQARAEKLTSTIALMSKEEKSARSYISLQDPLAEAEILFREQKYFECLFMTFAIIESTLRGVLKKNGFAMDESSTLGETITIAQKSMLFKDEVINLLRYVAIHRNQIVHQRSTPSKEDARNILSSAHSLINSLGAFEGAKKDTANNSRAWKPYPKMLFEIGQFVPRVCTFPQIAWQAFNDSPYQLKVWIEVHPILGGHDLHPLKDKDINGKSFYCVEPESYVFSSGCFTLPPECALSKEEIILEIYTKVEDVNNVEKGKYTLLPKRWKYVRANNTWSYYPQQLS